MIKKKLTKLVKFILEKHISPKFCLNIFEKITKVFGEKDSLGFMISSLQGTLEKKRDGWVG